MLFIIVIRMTPKNRLLGTNSEKEYDPKITCLLKYLFRTHVRLLDVDHMLALYFILMNLTKRFSRTYNETSYGPESRRFGVYLVQVTI